MQPAASALLRQLFFTTAPVLYNLLMRTLFSLIALLAWGLWFGAIMALFIFVQVLFAHDRSVAVRAAPQLFLSFEKYQLVLAAVVLIATCAWRLTTRRAILTVLFTLLAIATLSGLVPTLYITPKMEALRLAGQSASHEFMKLHGITMIFYLLDAIMLLASGCVLPFALRFQSAPKQPNDKPEIATV
jgi:hypothetical protein